VEGVSPGKQAQLVLQDPSGSLNPRRTVYRAVAEGLRIHGEVADERERVADAPSRAGLRPPERYFLRHPHELSGGQRQRVVIAGALVLEPTLLVADEPVASLDVSVRGEILSLLLRLRDDLGLAALVVTHDLGLAWNIADRVAVMYLGRVVETGPVGKVLTAPEHPYTQALLSVLPEGGRPVVLQGEPRRPRPRPDPGADTGADLGPCGLLEHQRAGVLVERGADAERHGEGAVASKSSAVSPARPPACRWSGPCSIRASRGWRGLTQTSATASCKTSATSFLNHPVCLW